VERLREGPVRTGDTEDGEYELFDVEDAAQTMHEAADRISTLERELVEMRSAVEQLRGESYLASAEAAEFHRDNAVTMWDAERARATAAEAKVARRGEALKPFASEASRYGEYGDGSQRAWLNCTVADLRAARSALQSENDREGGK
jgi:chromosome segregation ATPase